MSPRIRRLLASAAVLAGLAVSQAASALSVYDVIMMSRNGYEPESIIRLINDTGSAFTLEAMDAVRLKDAGVSDEVVAAMFAAGPLAAADEGGEAMAGEMPPPATMADLLLLAEGRISEQVIIAFLDSRGISFNPDSAAVVRLRDAGLGEQVLNHLVTRTAIRPVPDPQYVAPAEPAAPATPPATAYAPPSEDRGMSGYGEGSGYLSPPEYRTTYIYPSGYYGPSYFIGFSGLHHSMFRHRYRHAHPYPGHWFFDRKHAFFHGKKHKHGQGKHDDHDKDWHRNGDRDHGGWSRAGARIGDRYEDDGRSSTGNTGSSGIVRGWSGREDSDRHDSWRSRSSMSSGSTWSDLHRSRSPGTGLSGISSRSSGMGSRTSGAGLSGIGNRTSGSGIGSRTSGAGLSGIGSRTSGTGLSGTDSPRSGSSAASQSSRNGGSVTESSSRSSAATDSASGSRSSRDAGTSSRVTRGWSGRTDGGNSSRLHHRR